MQFGDTHQMVFLLIWSSAIQQDEFVNFLPIASSFFDSREEAANCSLFTHTQKFVMQYIFHVKKFVDQEVQAQQVKHDNKHGRPVCSFSQIVQGSMDFVKDSVLQNLAIISQLSVRNPHQVHQAAETLQTIPG